MPTTHQITCINKSDRQNLHERITQLGGVDASGNRWKFSEQDAINGIENGNWQVFVSINGQSVRVIVAFSLFGNKYLKTETMVSGPTIY